MKVITGDSTIRIIGLLMMVAGVIGFAPFFVSLLGLTLFLIALCAKFVFPEPEDRPNRYPF